MVDDAVETAHAARMQAGMSPAQQADAEIQVLVSAYQDAASRAGVDEESYAAALAGASLPNGELAKYQGGARNLLELAPQIGRWATVYKRWALNGQRDDGTAYSLSRWLGVAKEYSDAVELQAGVAVDRSFLLESAGDKYIATEKRVKDAVNDAADRAKKTLGDLWETIPLWVKAAGAVTIGTVVLGVVGFVVYQVRSAARDVARVL